MFSPNQEKVLKLLGDRKMTIGKLTEKFVKKYGTTSIDPSNYVASTIRKINQKCEYHHLDWMIDGSGHGRGGKTIWKSKRK